MGGHFTRGQYSTTINWNKIPCVVAVCDKKTAKVTRTHHLQGLLKPSLLVFIIHLGRNT
jgi:hypothetical protein